MSALPGRVPTKVLLALKKGTFPYIPINFD
jgi:hypothetical protein